MAKHRARTTVFATLGGLFLAGVGFIAGQTAPPVTEAVVDRYFPGIFTTIEEKGDSSSTMYSFVSSWPFAPCVSPSPVAVLSNDITVQTIEQKGQSYDPQTLVDNGMAVPWEEAYLTLILSSKHAGDQIIIQNITPIVYEYSEDINPAWTVAGRGGGCGGAYQRTFDLNLRRGTATLEDLGVSQGAGPQPSEVPVESLQSHAWTVAQDDISEVTFHAEPNDGYYEFGLKIEYVVNGQINTREIGSSENPFRVAGGNEPTNRYVYDRYTNSLVNY